MKKFWFVIIMTFCFGLTINSYAGEKYSFYSQFGQDKYVFESFFKDKKDGIFVDVGAYDGVVMSNSKFFEDTMNWKGICIEPIPEIFEKLQKTRKAKCIHGCISNTEGVAQFFHITSEKCCVGMLSGLLDKYDPRHMHRAKRETDEADERYEVINVPCYLLNNILEENDIYHIDYLSIDTEGGELDILKSIDFDKFDIEIIGVENNFNDPMFQQFLKTKGYVLIKHLGCDEIYKKYNRGLWNRRRY